MSYLVDYFHFQGLLRWGLILIFMMLKAGLIVAVFMHMAWERLALIYAILLPPLALAGAGRADGVGGRPHAPDAAALLPLRVPSRDQASDHCRCRAARPMRVAPWRSYLELTKPRVVALMMFTVVVGMLLSTPGPPPWRVLVFGTLGIASGGRPAQPRSTIWSTSASTRMMARTRGRPLPRGVLGDGAGLGVRRCAGRWPACRCCWRPPTALCAALTLASLVGYAVVYSLVPQARARRRTSSSAAPPARRRRCWAGSR